MKVTIRFVLFLLLMSFGTAKAQDVDTVLAYSQSFSDTLTATTDTIEVRFGGGNRWDFQSVVAYTTTGTDTILVSTLSADGFVWVQQGLRDLSDNTYDVSIIVTTTPKEFVILDSYPRETRLQTDDVSASAVIILAGKLSQVRR